MDAAQFAQFWQMQGYKVIKTKSCYWYSPQFLFFMSLPFHCPVVPSRSELARVLLAGPAIAVRFLSEHDGSGKDGGLFICADRNYDFKSLHQKARNQTRRGLENCLIKQIDFEYLAENGHKLNKETFIRQGRNPQTMTARQWRLYCKAASVIPDFEAWGAFIESHLAAFIVAAQVESCFYILHHSSATEYLKYYPNNALIFTVTKMKLSSPKVAFVSYGLKSLDETCGLDHFKLRMGFELKLFKDCVIFNPLLKPFLNLVGHKIINWIARLRPESDLWRKASSVLSISSRKLNAQ
jgi:hypothetical protein